MKRFAATVLGWRIHAALLAAVGLILAGVAMVSVPAALVGAGLSILAVLTFDPNRAGRMTWPR